MVIYTVLAKKIEKIKKNLKKSKKLKMLGTISGALARSLIQSWQKYRKNQKNIEKIKKPRKNFWGPCQVLNIYRYISQQSILKQRFQKTHFQMVLEVEIFFAVDLANF